MRNRETGASETAMLIVLALAVSAMLGMASLITSRYRRMRQELTRSWFNQGEQQLAAGRPEIAIQDYRNALAYGHDSSQYRLKLAQALVAAGHATEAQEYLLSLWQKQPGDGSLNLLLARLNVRESNNTEALQYYRNAIYGIWADDPEAHRRATRFELADFLLARHRTSEARAELIALSADMPHDPALLTRLGEKFLAVDDPANARTQFSEALKARPDFSPALAGAGEAAYTQGDYRGAEVYLTGALRAEPNDTRLRQMLDIARTVLALDPYEPHLGARERANRVLENFRLARQRLQQCAAQGANPAMASLLAAADQFNKTGRTLHQDLDLQNEIMRWVRQSEGTTGSFCGAPTGTDQALMLIARGHPFLSQGQ